MAMKKFINSPENLVSELLEGFVLANQAKVALSGSNLVVRANPNPACWISACRARFLPLLDRPA